MSGSKLRRSIQLLQNRGRAGYEVLLMQEIGPKKQRVREKNRHSVEQYERWIRMKDQKSNKLLEGCFDAARQEKQKGSGSGSGSGV